MNSLFIKTFDAKALCVFAQTENGHKVEFSLAWIRIDGWILHVCGRFNAKSKSISSSIEMEILQSGFEISYVQK